MRLGTILIGALFVTLAATPTRADILLGVQAGAGYLRLGDLEDFWDQFGINHNTDDLAFQWEVSGTWRFAPRHAVRLSVERITTSINLYFLSPFGSLLSEQNLTTVPICASYEFAIATTPSGASTLLGLGGGIYATEIEGNELNYFGDPALDSIVHHSREGTGYGFHGYLRQTAPISERLAISGMLRGRWADGMAFDDSEQDVPVDFTDFDFAVGLEWKI